MAAADEDDIVGAIAALLGAQARMPSPQDRLQRPGTVSGYNATTRRADVIVDGDSASVNMAVTMSTTPTAGMRVMVSFEAPRGIFCAAPL